VEQEGEKMIEIFCLILMGLLALAILALAGFMICMVIEGFLDIKDRRARK
jgi:hypothetical protein